MTTKKKIKIATSTWLPMFPGFYETWFTPDDMLIEDDIKDYARENNLSDEIEDAIMNYVYISTEYSEAYKDAEKNVVRETIKVVERALEKYVTDIELEEIVSPRFYNYSNDSINVKVSFSKENIEAIKNAIAENMEDWKSYLKFKYTSCDGFISHYSNRADDEEWQIDNALQGKHTCGAVLNFLGVLEYEGDWGCREADWQVCSLDAIESKYVFIDIERLIAEMKEKGEYPE